MSVPVESDEPSNAVRQSTFFNTIDKNANEIEVLQKSGINYATEAIVQTVTNGDTTHAPSGDAVFDYVTPVAVAAAAAVLTTTITDGDTAHAPDGNSVFDALALKADLPQHVAKPSDQTYNANVLTDDTALQFTVVANGVYMVEALIWHLASTAGSPFKFSFSLPSGTFDTEAVYMDSGANVWGGWSGPGTASNTELVSGLQSFLTTSQPLHITSRVAIGGTGGTVKFRFKDDTDGDTLTIKAGSWFTATKVG